MTNASHPIDIAELRRLLLDLEKLQAWLREPDWADTFGTREITAWLNNRPTAVLPASVGKISALLDCIEAEEWRPIETAPGDDCAALLYFASERDETVLLGNDYALSIGFWRNGRLHEQGTGHDILTEAKCGFCPMPTAWKRISLPTTGGDDA